MTLDTTVAGLLPEVAAGALPLHLDLIRPTQSHLASLAVSGPDGALSYAELHDQAVEIAGWLRDLGVQRGDLVALCVGRSSALVAAALAVWEVGAAYVALDPAHPDRRLQQLLVDSGAVVAVLGSGLAPRLGLTSPTPDLPGHLELVRLRSGAPVGPAPDLAYVVYTSGSTGAPKGVLVTTAGVSNLISWHQRAFKLTQQDRCTQVAAPGFDALAWEVWPCLAAGASLHIPPDAVKTDAAALRDWLVAEKITVSFLPTPLAEAVIALDWPADTSLRLLLTGGDRMHRRPRPGLPFTVVNNYGVSEATVVSTSGIVHPAEDDSPPSIGCPIDGVQVRVVNEALEIVPDGEPGELLVAGVSLAVGYLGRPDLTQQSFVSAPYPDDRDARWYRTGDLVRWLPDGELEYLGRRDDQVKIRGNRVEPGEIATVLDRHPAVARCVVVPAPDGQGGTSLIGYVRLIGADKPTGEDLRAYAVHRLPTAMVPAQFVMVEKFPITLNGKIDRDALLALGVPEPAGAPPIAEIEQVVADLVADVLGIATVSADDNFILLGGDSLLAARLMVRIADRFDVELPLRTVFERPTVTELAAEVSSLSHH